MQTEKKKLIDTDSNEIFNMSSKVDDYKKTITKANEEMEGIIKKLSKLKVKKTVQPPIKETSSIGTETILSGPTYEEKQKAADTINAIVTRNKTQDAFKQAKAATKIADVIKRANTQDAFKQAKAEQKLVDAAKRVRIQKGYIRKRDKKKKINLKELKNN
jgi:hypothetical protein